MNAVYGVLPAVAAGAPTRPRGNTRASRAVMASRRPLRPLPQRTFAPSSSPSPRPQRTLDLASARVPKRCRILNSFIPSAHWCARHPWRVVGTWLGIVVVLIGLNAAFHGKLINDFKIPGSDTQKATDLITAKFGAQKGAALRVVVAAPSGERLDTGARASAIRH